MLLPRSVPSERAPGVPEPEELWEAEMERLRGSGAPVRGLPYAMMDKRLIWQLREPAGVQTLRWQRWQRRRQTVERRLREAAQRLARGLGLWEGALYEIGGLFGTGIRSYFTFLRFLLLLNLLSLLLTASFVLLPLAWLRPPDPGPVLNLTLQCPGSSQSQPGVLRFHNQLWHVLTGRAFTNTYLFYGAYRVGPESSSVYSIRLAYLLSPLACLLLCFCGTLQRMVKGLPQKTLLGQGYQAPLSAKVFSSWDFCIRVQEAATIKKHEISNEFKVELEEGRRFQLMQRQTRAQRACHLLSYLRVNVLIGLLVVGAISAIFWATKYSQDNKEESLFLLLQYLPPGVIALVNFLGPLLFTFLVQLENYPPNTEVNLTLIWCVVLKLASLGMFSLSLGQTILCIGRDKTSCESYGYNACDYQCWENSIGEELYKLSIFNFLLTVAFAFLVTLPRRLLVDRFSGRFWAWLEREEFLVPKNVLDIVAGQTVTWMGLFYCPLLPLLNSVFLFLTFYIKKYTLLKNSRASSRPFRASSSTFFFQLVLLLGLLLAAVPLGYVHPLLLGLRPLHQLLSPLASGSGAGGPWAPAHWPACPPLPGLPRLQLPPPHHAQPCPDGVHLPDPGQCQGHPQAPEAAGVGSGEVAPGGGSVATAAGARPERLSGPQVPCLPSFAPAVLLPRIPMPWLPGPPGPAAGPLRRGCRGTAFPLPWTARYPGLRPQIPLPQGRGAVTRTPASRKPPWGPSRPPYSIFQAPGDHRPPQWLQGLPQGSPKTDTQPQGQ
ncbi:transmembrane channel-like protein 8 isoform X2 [Hylobates moloch]|uniref:transmembrane channel-like protein 8 isoform X2 n=1 Tax=Hylobates moloch TaxID=81572 RepID=UPI0026775F7B|nr:transmembrane channel-like protein 8 isoform X2 [Hylobates moloch]